MLLVLNAGSSSLKFSLYDDAPAGADPAVRHRGQIEGLLGQARFVVRDGAGAEAARRDWPEGVALGHDGAMAFLLDWIRTDVGGAGLKACGHRVVHGGREFTRPVLVDEAVLERLQALVPLAPLHQPHNLSPIRAIRRALPGLPQVACFDTAFHRTQPWEAETFALPAKLTAQGILRYGFHGLSYEYIAEALRGLDPVLGRGRVVVAHLGNGASMCALDDGRSVATTMGFTPIDGLPMGTRSGAIDPGVILYLLRQRGMSAEQVERLLMHESGLLGVSGVSSDMRTLREKAASEPGAARALQLFAYRIVREVGSLAAALGGLDALVFTAGIGENDRALRAEVCRALGWLGIELDDMANARAGGTSPPTQISRSGRCAAWVIPTNEELMIVRHTSEALADTPRA
ncbi:MAG: acetate/propionate family kinase [Alphaproteobacteria bacterium]|nr:acetate/propionate family kinase [Alphaproteobacteria bacterium]